MLVELSKSKYARHRHRRGWWSGVKFEVCKYHSVVVGTTEICGGHHRKLWRAPQNSVVDTTEICGGHHRNLWWAPQKSVVDSRRTEFSERKRKQVLSYGEKYLLNGRCYSVDTYMYEHMLHKVSIAESPNKGCNRVLQPCAS